MNSPKHAAKTVIITGATRGLGRELSLAFAKSGHRVFGFFRSDEKAAELMRKEFSDLGLAGEFVRHDISLEGKADLWKEIIEEADSLTLINNACAPFEPTAFHLLEWEQFQLAFEVAVKGSFLCTQAVLRKMAQQRRGVIVNVLTSALTGIPPKGFSSYLVAKSALQALTKSLAIEYAERGIRIFSVSPSHMETGLTTTWHPTLRSQIATHGIRPMNPALVATYVHGLVEDPNVPGRGEDYVLPVQNGQVD